MEKKKYTIWDDVKDNIPGIGSAIFIIKSVLFNLAFLFYLPSEAIRLCARLGVAGKMLLTLMMAAIGFITTVFFFEEVFNIRSKNVLEIAAFATGSAVFAFIGWKFAWSKAVQLNEMPSFEAAKRILFLCIILFLILFVSNVALTQFGKAIDDRSGYLGDKDLVMGCSVALVMLYWLVRLTRSAPGKDIPSGNDGDTKVD